jgi:hypothetical protein
MSYLPSFNCLFLSPLNLWSNDVSNIINNEREILESIPSLSKRYADIIFGIPQEYFSSKKPLTYAITLLLNNASNEYRQDLKKRLFALDEQQQQNDIIHIYFSRKSLLYYLPLLLIYIVVFLYIYYSVCKYLIKLLKKSFHRHSEGFRWFRSLFIEMHVLHSKKNPYACGRVRLTQKFFDSDEVDPIPGPHLMDSSPRKKTFLECTSPDIQQCCNIIHI